MQSQKAAGRAAPALCAGAFAMGLAPAPVAAHGLAVMAEVDCSRISVEASYTDGAPVAGGMVEILDAQESLVRRIGLDAGGRVDFPIAGLDTDARVTVRVEAGEHSGFWDIIPEDFARGCPR